ncbi:uncharacterized protein LOC62_03G003665 [Vanrija pseudolonga]|uniref:Uncharacterized protein n=1 Tax=Vanrija pseudolonga TaxID=143232 RepID=A0AAF0Y536_9TREE|nr:hypothetical protein LOC62_03G003665 [Vanrija pseudolonga]
MKLATLVTIFALAGSVAAAPSPIEGSIPAIQLREVDTPAGDVPQPELTDDQLATVNADLDAAKTGLASVEEYLRDVLATLSGDDTPSQSPKEERSEARAGIEVRGNTIQQQLAELARLLQAIQSKAAPISGVGVGTKGSGTTWW